MRSAKRLLTALVVAGIAVAVPVAYQTQAQAAQTRTAVSADPAYQNRVVLAHEHCRHTAAVRTYPGMSTCVGGLAGPAQGNPQQADIWNVFLDCLSGWYKALDGMYPDPEAEVNNCLERHGWDVQP